MGGEGDNDSIRAWIWERSSLLPLRVPEEHRKAHPGCEGRGCPGSGTSNAPGTGFTGCGRRWVPPLRTQQKSHSCFLSKLLGPTKPSSLIPSTQSHPTGAAPFSPYMCLSPDHARMVAQVCGQVPPQITLLRDQQKLPAEQLACRTRCRVAVCSKWSCMPWSGHTNPAAAGPPALLPRPSHLPGCEQGQQRSSKQQEQSCQYVSLQEVHRDCRQLSSLLLFPVPGAVAQTHAQNRGEPHQP